MKLTEKYADRHPSTLQLLRWLEPNPNLPALALVVAEATKTLVDEVLAFTPEDGPELSTGLRRVLEAKDCFVRQVLSAATE